MRRSAEPNRLLHWTLWSVLVLVIFGLMVAYAYRSFRAASQNPDAPLPHFRSVPEFTLSERSGRPFSGSELKGKVWVADFIFTTCPGPCPLVSARFQELQRMIERTPDVRLVSFTVDPETDTPEVLARYANHLQADPEKWLFLTGEKSYLYTLIQQHFLLPVTPNPRGAQGPEGAVLHSTKLVLVDARGDIRGFYDGLATETLPHVLRDIGTLLREHGKDR
jgi:protein SCO1/2